MRWVVGFSLFNFFLFEKICSHDKIHKPHSHLQIQPSKNPILASPSLFPHSTPSNYPFKSRYPSNFSTKRTYHGTKRGLNCPHFFPLSNSQSQPLYFSHTQIHSRCPIRNHSRPQCEALRTPNQTIPPHPSHQTCRRVKGQISNTNPVFHHPPPRNIITPNNPISNSNIHYYPTPSPHYTSHLLISIPLMMSIMNSSS